MRRPVVVNVLAYSLLMNVVTIGFLFSRFLHTDYFGRFSILPNSTLSTQLQWAFIGGSTLLNAVVALGSLRGHRWARTLYICGLAGVHGLSLATSKKLSDEPLLTYPYAFLLAMFMACLLYLPAVSAYFNTAVRSQRRALTVRRVVGAALYFFAVLFMYAAFLGIVMKTAVFDPKTHEANGVGALFILAFIGIAVAELCDRAPDVAARVGSLMLAFACFGALQFMTVMALLNGRYVTPSDVQMRNWAMALGAIGIALLCKDWIGRRKAA